MTISNEWRAAPLRAGKISNGRVMVWISKKLAAIMGLQPGDRVVFVLTVEGYRMVRDSEGHKMTEMRRSRGYYVNVPGELFHDCYAVDWHVSKGVCTFKMKGKKKGVKTC